MGLLPLPEHVRARHAVAAARCVLGSVPGLLRTRPLWIPVAHALLRRLHPQFHPLCLLTAGRPSPPPVGGPRPAVYRLGKLPLPSSPALRQLVRAFSFLPPIRSLSAPAAGPWCAAAPLFGNPFLADAAGCGLEQRCPLWRSVRGFATIADAQLSAALLRALTLGGSMADAPALVGAWEFKQAASLAVHARREARFTLPQFEALKLRLNERSELSADGRAFLAAAPVIRFLASRGTLAACLPVRPLPDPPFGIYTAGWHAATTVVGALSQLRAAIPDVLLVIPFRDLLSGGCYGDRYCALVPAGTDLGLGPGETSFTLALVTEGCPDELLECYCISHDEYLAMEAPPAPAPAAPAARAAPAAPAARAAPAAPAAGVPTWATVAAAAPGQDPVVVADAAQEAAFALVQRQTAVAAAEAAAEAGAAAAAAAAAAASGGSAAGGRGEGRGGAAAAAPGPAALALGAPPGPAGPLPGDPQEPMALDTGADPLLLASLLSVAAPDAARGLPLAPDPKRARAAPPAAAPTGPPAAAGAADSAGDTTMADTPCAGQRGGPSQAPPDPTV
ncbi:hypothetical protein HYH03_010916 [Edaphochlamys debaryana]|uniref:Uncharacterized protein n=1 Tax=Edaphochlamys debaryana TaxID=47281 RepID=A0A836BVL8_9CHLO|nr:hypothetical protein HYH03_010916 [Edaphochlamys debaryana]|eukprot:KAG2490766.1 hypothetical protein HYH03_010916 [Edaphochlamys debaryana]